MTSSTEDLWRRFHASGDAELRNQLVVHYAPLVKFVVGRLMAQVPSHVDPEDLISEGLIGLVGAVERFDPSLGLRFSTYAVPRILGAAKDSLRSWDWVPRAVRDQIRKLEAAREELIRTGAPVDEIQLATELGWSLADVRSIDASRVASLLSPLDNEVAGDPGTGPETSETLSVTADGLPQSVLDGIRVLPERDQVVLSLYYLECLTLVEIGAVLGLTESRVSQLKSKATSTLRLVLSSDSAG